MQETKKHNTAMLSMGALGIVYGDIGTSPLYALKECFSERVGLLPSAENILAIVSLIFWTLMLVVSLKYVLIVLRADDRGEGGIMTLLSLASRQSAAKWHPFLIMLGLIGAGLFLGDAVITPAMSVLSAMEGLNVVAPDLEKYALPGSLLVLVLLFSVQHFGTGDVGKWFGPIMLLWFFTLGLLGAQAIIERPQILQAIDPMHAANFIQQQPMLAFITLGAVVLCVTGAEALYADMGHFGRGPIRLAWGSIVFPALLLNYFGQGALILADPTATENPFYLLAPTWALLPLVALATLATIIASQAVISGVYSLVRQSIQMGYLPRQEICHTSDKEIGQIYLPVANWILMACIIVVIVIFESSSNLAAAYGIAVTGTMMITTILLAFVAYHHWKTPLYLIVLLSIPALLIDIGLFSANAIKLFDGGWLPVSIAILAIIVMTTWRKGRAQLLDKHEKKALSLPEFIENIEHTSPIRVAGTGVFMARSPNTVPSAMLHNLRHNKVLHQRVIFLTLRTKEKPRVSREERVQIKALGHSFWQVTAFYGYKETPNIIEVLKFCKENDVVVSLSDTSFFLSRETLINTDQPGMARWREELFIWMNRNSLKATDFFKIPINRVVELGEQLEL
ncbi:MAG: potassium transporter Kup [Enterovibrio sp.]